jgi:predicted lactoylglutathione lyase
MTRQIYVNLVTADLPRSIEFFRKLGFEFNPQFTNDDAACMIINADAYVMLLTEAMFPRFSKRAMCDTSKATEVMLAVSCDSRAAVDALVNQAIAAGGSHAMDPMDHGFMYGWSFYDLDGHHWEVMWMDPATIEQ